MFYIRTGEWPSCLIEFIKHFLAEGTDVVKVDLNCVSAGCTDTMTTEFRIESHGFPWMSCSRRTLVKCGVSRHGWVLRDRRYQARNHLIFMYKRPRLDGYPKCIHPDVVDTYDSTSENASRCQMNVLSSKVRQSEEFERWIQCLSSLSYLEGLRLWDNSTSNSLC